MITILIQGTNDKIKTYNRGVPQLMTLYLSYVISKFRIKKQKSPNDFLDGFYRLTGC